MMKGYLVAIGAACLVLGCGKAELEEAKQANEKLNAEVRSLKSSLNNAQTQLARMQEIDKRMGFWVGQMRDVKARIVTNMGTIEVKFYPEKAPIHCFSFITRAEGGFYNNTQFHRVIEGFMIQGGDPNSKDNDPYNDGGGGPLVNIPHEFNDTQHMPGILSMARISDPSAGAGCQFFIMHGAKSYLDGQYTAFGEVTNGMDVVDKIAKVDKVTNDPRVQDRPAKPVVIRRIEVFR